MTKYYTLAIVLGMTGLLGGVFLVMSSEQKKVFAVTDKTDIVQNTSGTLSEKFSSLQAYLDWGKKSKIADAPYYKEIAKEQYQITPTRGIPHNKTVYSYEELRKKLKFTR